MGGKKDGRNLSGAEVNVSKKRPVPQMDEVGEHEPCTSTTSTLEAVTTEELVNAAGDTQQRGGDMVDLEEQVANPDVPLFNVEIETFQAFYWANWRMVARDLETCDRKKIF